MNKAGTATIPMPAILRHGHPTPLMRPLSGGIKRNIALLPPHTGGSHSSKLPLNLLRRFFRDIERQWFCYCNYWFRVRIAIVLAPSSPRMLINPITSHARPESLSLFEIGKRLIRCKRPQ